MKKIMLAMAALCCVAVMSLTLNSCEPKNTPSESTELVKMDPYLVWGAGIADVQAHMDAKDWYKNGNDSLQYWEGLGWHRWYWVADSTLTEQYLFETKEGQNLVCVECYNYNPKITYADGQKYLTDRGYIYLSKGKFVNSGEPYDLYLSADKQTRVYLIKIALKRGGEGWYLFITPSVNRD